MRQSAPPYRRLLPLLLLLAWLQQPVEARQAPYIPVDDPVQPFMGPLLLEGVAPGINPTSWPLSQADVSVWLRDSSPTSAWARTTAKRLSQRLSGLSTSGVVQADVRAGIRLASQDRRDLLRSQEMDGISWQPMLLGRTWIKEGAWTASLGVRIDRWYEVDPDGMDTAHRWLTRAEDAYIAREGRFVDVFFGRMGRHWGNLGGPGLLLSANPRPMDQLAWRIGTDRLHVRSIIAELDSFTGDGRMTGTAGADSVGSGSTRRMLAAHRLTFRATGAWTVGLSHATLYSGPGSGVSLKFANPFNVALWEVDNRPKNDENNGMVGAFFSFRGQRTMAGGELVLDDVDVLNGVEPASLAAHLSVVRRGIAPDLNVGLAATMATARAYNSEQVEGRWVYLGRGIAVQEADFAHLRGYVEWLGRPGWLIRTGVEVLREGEADLYGTLPSLDEKTLFTGTPLTTIRPFIQIHGMTKAGFDVGMEAGWNRTQDAAHVAGSVDAQFRAALSIAYRLSGSHGL